MKVEHDFEEQVMVFLIVFGEQLKGAGFIKFSLLSIECI
jgi:hypothetical protein